MPEYRIPKNSGPFRIVISRAGTPLVVNDYTGQRKVCIPCRNMPHAKEVCQVLNADEHDGSVHA